VLMHYKCAVVQKRDANGCVHFSTSTFCHETHDTVIARLLRVSYCAMLPYSGSGRYGLI